VRRTGIILAAVLGALAAVPAASASFIVDRGATEVTLRVSGTRAIVDYRAHGHLEHAVLWGAVDARQPSPTVPQVSFHVRFGHGRLAGGGCGRYDGPALPLLVAACKAPDGSYWALQSWRRLLPDYGGRTAPSELHASHWTGPLPKLEVWQDWSAGRVQHFFGRLTYHGRPVYGLQASSAGNPLDGYGRNVYLATLDSRYGPGWRRENSFLTHRPTGAFCYALFPHGNHPSGAGKEYRMRVSGPGVTPIVEWRGASLGAFDRGLENRMTALERSLGDARCRRS
jgi:hypothetical protein